VRLGMRYGEPSLKSCFLEMKNDGIEKFFLAPLYPQYAQATTSSAEKKFSYYTKDFQLLKPFYNNEDYIKVCSEKLQADWQTQKWQHILFSFHGLPESQVKKNRGCLQSENCCVQAQACEKNCYRAQCFATARLIASNLNLLKSQYTVCFQSRVGPAKWIQPSTLDTVKVLAAKGVKSLLVQSPSFVADCLETLEEVAIELKDEFKEVGGQDLKLVPCLNDDASWVKVFSQIVLNELKS
jgi:protoporphyrin/coproporphyrin ferrochelatase